MHKEGSDASPSHDDRPSHAQAATVAGMQFIVALAAVVVLAIIALVVFLVRSLGWGSLGPLALIGVILAIAGYVVRTIRGSSSNH